jgi:hypothetical protein
MSEGGEINETQAFLEALDRLPVPPTRTFEERDPEYRAMDDPALRRRLLAASVRMASAMQAVFSREPDAVIPFTGQPMTAATFVMHSRSECAIHRWDMVGDDELSWELLSQPEITSHAVNVLGPMLFSRGCLASPAPAGGFAARIRANGQPDLLVRRDEAGAQLRFVPDDGSPAIETDAAARPLFIWGRRPGDPSRIRSGLSAEDRVRLQSLLAGF